ncbi:hypothetical protein [Tunturiibacter psychrotolerans]|uniref:hypothetical protein n=1 Tax=Tunturiibacter psychrotolerans TaxID=3069686 RepID=UPI003D2606B3
MHDTLLGWPEVYWVAVQAGCAVVGLIVLTLYTIYTRRMMKLAEQTKRASMTPTFSVTKQNISGPTFDPATLRPFVDKRFTPPRYIFSPSFTVRNVGQGPAILIRCWHQGVSSGFTLRDSIRLLPTPISEPGTVNKQDLVKDERCQASFENADLTRPWLFVIEANDAAKGTNQLQILMRPRREDEGDGPEYITHWVMMYGWGDTIAERFVAAATRFVQVIKAIEKMVNDLDSRDEH